MRRPRCAGLAGPASPLAVPAEFEHRPLTRVTKKAQALQLQRLQAVADQGGPNAFRALQQMRQLSLSIWPISTRP
jgi:hypothetical protein